MWGIVEDVIINLMIAFIEKFADFINDNNAKLLARVTEITSVTPVNWLDGKAWEMTEAVSRNVMVPVAGLILTYIASFEFINTVMEKNNYHEFQIFDLFKFVFKISIYVLVVNHATDIISGAFQLGTFVVTKAYTITSAHIFEPQAIPAEFLTSLEALSIGELAVITLLMGVNLLITAIAQVVVPVIIYARFMEILLYSSMAPIPIATFGNREWNVGNNYIRTLFALAFQGFLIIFVVALYILVNNTLTFTEFTGYLDILGSFIGRMGWTVLLCVMLMRTGNIARSIMNAH